MSQQPAATPERDQLWRDLKIAMDTSPQPHFVTINKLFAVDILNALCSESRAHEVIDNWNAALEAAAKIADKYRGRFYEHDKYGQDIGANIRALKDAVPQVDHRPGAGSSVDGDAGGKPSPAVADEPERIGTTPTEREPSAEASGKAGTEARQYTNAALNPRAAWPFPTGKDNGGSESQPRLASGVAQASPAPTNSYSDKRDRSFPICADHRTADWNMPDIGDGQCVLCRLFYLEAQEILLEEWQQRADRAEAALAETKRPLDAQMARLNATVVQLNGDKERLERELLSALNQRNDEARIRQHTEKELASLRSARSPIPTEEMADSVRGITQILRNVNGATFESVRLHCEQRGDDLMKWPQWARDSEGYVTEMAAACLVYEVMEAHRPDNSSASSQQEVK